MIDAKKLFVSATMHAKSCTIVWKLSEIDVVTGIYTILYTYIYRYLCINSIHSRRRRCNLNMHPWKKIFLFEHFAVRFHFEFAAAAWGGKFDLNKSEQI